MAFASITQLSNLLIPAYDRLVTFELREMPRFRSIVDRRPTDVTNPGATVNFTWYADLPTTTTPLNEETSPASLTIANPTRTSVTINEYGTWVPKTIVLRKEAFTKPDTEIAELLARQQSDTIDELILGVLDTGTNTMTKAANLSAGTVREVRNHMRSDNVPFKDGSNYLAFVHPDVTFDLMSESGDNVWASPHTYGGDTGAIYVGEVGKYSAVRFIENTRVTTTAPASGVAGTYNSYVVGKQALCEAVAIEPHTVIGPQTDPLRRHFPVGWYGLLGWALFRPESLLVLETRSSLAPALP